MRLAGGAIPNMCEALVAMPAQWPAGVGSDRLNPKQKASAGRESNSGPETENGSISQPLTLLL